MSILLVLIPISLLLLGIAIAAFVWAVKRGQYDDLDTPALDILIDDERPAPVRAVPAAAGLRQTSAADAAGVADAEIRRVDGNEDDIEIDIENTIDADRADAGPSARSRD